jgi:hypothetical protein
MSSKSETCESGRGKGGQARAKTKAAVQPLLSDDELVSIRRSAEDAVRAMNHRYAPFIDTMANPLRVIALVDMARGLGAPALGSDGLSELSPHVRALRTWMIQTNASPVVKEAFESILAHQRTGL